MIKHTTLRNSPNIPTGVKVIAILEYVYAVLFLLSALAVFIYTYFVNWSLIYQGMYAGMSAEVLIALTGIILLIFAAFSFVIGRGLWKGRNWARILEIVFSIIGVSSSFILVVNGALWGFGELIVDGIIVSYLLFNRNVKSFFNHGHDYDKA